MRYTENNNRLAHSHREKLVYFHEDCCLKNINERGSYPLEIRLEMMDTKMMKDTVFILQKEQEDYKVKNNVPMNVIVNLAHNMQGVNDNDDMHTNSETCDYTLIIMSCNLIFIIETC